jgi:hypothetical protein
MGDTDMRATRDRIETVEKRIAAMQDAGVDTAALRAQLAFAHHALREGRLADIEAICDEVLGAARRLAELGSRASQVRTPAYGTPVLAREPAAPGTEALRKVKVGRAQLAEEVRAAIDAEVKTQMTTPSDLAPLDQRLAALEARLGQALGQVAEASAAVAGPVGALANRIEALEQRPTPSVDEAAIAAAVAGQISALGSRIDALEQRPTPSIDEAAIAAAVTTAVAGPIGALATRLSALEQKPTPSIDEAAIAAIVTRTVDEAVPRQASELLRDAIAKLPTRDDLQQITETLRADLDWCLEKAAAEHGWCSLSDVQQSVRKAVAEQDPGTITGGSQLGRLEIALAEFVQQSKEQQDRLIAALADKVAQNTRSLTKRLLHRDPPEQVARKHDTEELSPSSSPLSGDASSHMNAITGAITGAIQREMPSKSPTEPALDPVPAETLDATRREHGSTTLFTKRVRVPVEQPEAAATPVSEPGDALHDLVTAEVERALGGATASTMSEPIAMTLGETAAPTTCLPPSSALVQPDRADLAVLVAAEVGRQLAMTMPVNVAPADSDLARAVARVLPLALQDESVRTELFAVLALEAAGKPGVFGELTGLRRYLKRELQATAAQLGSLAGTPV